jgi:hypothetical protein
MADFPYTCLPGISILKSGLHAWASSHGGFGPGARCCIQEDPADTAEIRESVYAGARACIRVGVGEALLLD